MKKIYNYKDGKAYFDNDVKMPISDKEYDMLFMEDGCLCERGNKVYDYLNNLLAPNKFTEAKLTDILTYIREHNVEYLTKVYEEEDVEMDYLYVDGELMWLSDGYNEFSKGDEKWEKFLAEVKKIDKDVETIKNKTMKNIKFSELISEYDYKRELEVCYDRHSNRILIYKYVAHTKDEEGGDFIADFELSEFETEFEKKFGYKPEMMKDYDEI